MARAFAAAGAHHVWFTACAPEFHRPDTPFDASVGDT
jgi:hypothetical protein